MIPANTTTDALIIGGGPAGLASALALRQKGIDCLVVDALQPPIEKGCGEGLMPDTLHSLSQLGVTITPEDGHPFVGIRFLHAAHHVDACFPNGHGVGVRRTHLHRRMHQQAAAAGARFAWGAHARLAPGNKVLLSGSEVSFRWVIGADGNASRVRNWAGLEAIRHSSERLGFRRHYRIAPWSDHVEVHWGPSGQVYITPVAADQICLIYATRLRNTNRPDLLDDFPDLAHRLRNAPIITPQRAAVSASKRLRRVATTITALVGDSSGSVDAITGDGLAMCFRQALALADSLVQGSLEPYNQAHPSIGKLPHRISRLLLLMDRWPILQGPAIQALDANRSVFEDLLSLHVGARSLPVFALRRGPSIGWSFLTASMLSITDNL